MIVDELVLKLQADISDLEKKLNKLDADAEKRGKSLGEKLFAGIKSVAAPLAGLFAGAKITEFFSTAIKNAQKFEQSMLKAESAAKAFGQSVRATKSEVQDLASDGFLTLQQSARSMQLALSAGFSTKEAGKFITALKDVSAQGNIIGDAGQSIEDFFKGVLTNSADLIENINPQIRKINTEYQKLKTTVGEAKAQQFLYNETLKFSAKFQGDAARYLETSEGAMKRLNAEFTAASTEIGRSLEPLFSRLIGLLTDFVKMARQATTAIREFIDSFSQTSGERLVEEKMKLEELGKAAKLTADQKTRLAEINAQISQNYDKYLRQLGQENASLEVQANLIQKIDTLKKLSLKDLDARIKETNDKLIQATRATQETGLFNFIDVALPGGATGQAIKGQRINEVARLGQELALQQNVRESLVAEFEKQEKQAAKAGKATTKADPFGFREASLDLAKLETEYAKFLAQNKKLTKQQQAEALADFNQRKETVIRNLRTSYAAYIEDTLEADKLANEQQFKDQLAELERLNIAKGRKEEDYENKKAKLKEQYNKKNAEAELAAIARTAQAAGNIINGVGGAISGIRDNNAQQALGGIGQAVGAFSPAAGAIVSTVGSVVTTIQSFFNKSEEEAKKAREAEQRRHEEQLAILKLQADYQKSMLELDRARAELPFKQLQRELRLIDINAQAQELSGADAEFVKTQRLTQRQAAITNVLSSESGSISGGQLFGGVQGTSQSITQFLKERDAQAVAVTQFMGLVEQVGSGNLTLDQYYAIREQIKSYKGLVPDSLYNSIINKYSGDTAYGGTRTTYEGGVQKTTVIGNSSQISAARTLVSEIQSDTAIAENLLSLIEQQNQTQLEIAASSKQTAQNTTKIALREDRQRAFVDVFGGSLNSSQGTISTNTLPQSIGSAIAITRQTDSIYERIARTGEVTNDILRDIRFLMNELLKANDNNSFTNTGITVEQFAALDAEFTRLSR